MQLAQNFPINPPMQYGGYDNRSNYPSQSFADPRLARQQGYGQYMNAPQYAPTVYPDAVYPSQYLQGSNPQAAGLHQQVQHQQMSSHYNPQHSNLSHSQYPNNLPFDHQPNFNQGSYITQTRPSQQPRTHIK